jgi:hypothetical protein
MDSDLAQCHERTRRQAALVHAEVEHDCHLPPESLITVSLLRVSERMRANLSMSVSERGSGPGIVLSTCFICAWVAF